MTCVSRLLIVGVLVALSAGCSKGPLEVGLIQLGRSLNADNSVGTTAGTFKPHDTIYVSVHTTDTGAGTITVRWYYRGAMMSERSKPVSFTGAGATEFHLQTATGFPAGDYAVEVLLDGQSKGRRTFNVVDDR